MKYICDIKDINDTKCVQIGQQHFYLIRGEKTVQMFSLICPHNGGIVEPQGELLVCPIHKWKFDARTGRSVVGSKGLKEIIVTLEDGKIMADIEEDAATINDLPKDVDVTIKLLAHACLEINHNGFTLITDPWLKGPAFHGSWIQYPAPSCGPKDIHPDALLITHEHTDHCHPNTLKQLDRSMPVYFPAFPNQRMDKILSELGFTRLYPMTFGQPTRINEDITITCYDPTSNWNDSIQLIDIKGWRLLNLNDAGVNFRLVKLVKPVDLISSSFGSGASAYPMCWSHLSQDDSEKILADQIKAKKDMLAHASQIYGCPRVLLFASYFALYHPQHRKYQELLTKYKITPQEIRHRLAAQKINVLDMLPGDVWSPKISHIERQGYGDDVFSWETMASHLKARFDEAEFQRYYPSGYVYDEEKVTDYFLHWNLLPEIRYVKDYTFALSVIDANGTHKMVFQIKDGDIKELPSSSKTNLTIDIPVQLLMHLIKHNLSWDEVYIGYWCQFHHENPYNVAFWRLLQAPYYLKHNTLPGVASDRKIEAATPISAILESHGDLAGRLISRHGMYCVGCERVPMETLGEGAKKHGLTASDLEDLIGELNQAILLDNQPWK
jgi:CMP-N-acetylneuraminate monooxygenase